MILRRPWLLLAGLPLSLTGLVVRPLRAQEVTVRGTSAAERQRRSAEAVTVIETQQARQESADLGEVLARREGIAVRRGGGLGSAARISLNGLYDNQIRFFLDGVPLEYAGFGLGMVNVPVNLVERADVYRGVVPIRFGADALGGAINLVTNQTYRGTHAGASYEAGSFGTYRFTAMGSHRFEPSGFFVRPQAFLDIARNDYPITVDLGDATGRPVPTTVHRFHDAFLAYGGGLEFGLVDRPWAKRLLAKVFFTDYDKELQNNIVMSAPYGEAKYGETGFGATLRYEQPRLVRIRGVPVHLTALGGYSHRSIDFTDRSPWIYDWYGHRMPRLGEPGEVERGASAAGPTDQTTRQHATFGRVTFTVPVTTEHTFRLALAPTYVMRDGEDRVQRDAGKRDPVAASRDLVTMITGLEHQADVLDRRLENIAFVKDYVLASRFEDPAAGGRLHQSAHGIGAGDALRFRFVDGLFAKASYEYATRLPSPDEIFGNGVLIQPNLALEPETSHNANASLMLDAPRTPFGSFQASVGGFFRHAENLITIIGTSNVFSYKNVYAARTVGVDGSLVWTSPDEYLALEGNVTWQDMRNVSNDGAFRDYHGDRIPNRPWLFANMTARVQFAGVADAHDRISVSWTSRYVHEFARDWESLGLPESQDRVPSQLLHTARLSYLVRGMATVTTTLEVQNVTDARAYDFFGVQKPGRAYFVKGTIEY